MNKYSNLKRLAIFILMMTWLSACATLPPADPKHSASLHEEALRNTSLKNYPTAVAKYSEAILYNPQNSDLYLQQAEVLEAMLQNAEASRTYQLALDRLPQDHPARELIHYRYGLLLAQSKSKHKKANQSLKKVADPAMQPDLQGVIILYSGDPDSALGYFSKALKQTEDYDMRGRIHYHASLAQRDRGAIPESRNELFHAVNNASSLALKQHIRILFDELR